MQNNLEYISWERQATATGNFVDFMGDIIWLVNGKYHREEGPALIRKNGNKYWYKYGKLHRLDGPAADLSKRGYKEYYINGDNIASEEKYWKLVKLLHFL